MSKSAPFAFAPLEPAQSLQRLELVRCLEDEICHLVNGPINVLLRDQPRSSAGIQCIANLTLTIPIVSSVVNSRGPDGIA